MHCSMTCLRVKLKNQRQYNTKPFPSIIEDLHLFSRSGRSGTFGPQTSSIKNPYSGLYGRATSTEADDETSAGSAHDPELHETESEGPSEEERQLLGFLGPCLGRVSRNISVWCFFFGSYCVF